MNRISMIDFRNVFIAFLLFFFHTLSAQNSINIYEQSFNAIDSMLVEQKKQCFKTAVFVSERAYIGDTFENYHNEDKISTLAKLISYLAKSQHLDYKESDKETVNMHSAIFRVMSDTIQIVVDSTHMIIHKPYSYDFTDMWGEKDWINMFVSKLLTTKKGNCHSLPYLYKILSEEMGIPAYIAFAPNHIYIKSYSEKTGWYNTELTSGTFPIDAWIMASGYVTVEAIQNGLYMDTLSTKQSVANCLVDLAQGYQRKFGKDNPDFVVKCCNTCLKYHPTNVNAMLTKAEAQKYYIQAQMKTKNLKKPQDLFVDSSIKEMYEDMEQTYVKLHQLGYRRMPEEMYMQWMGMLKNEPVKYNNTKISITKKKN